MTDETGATRRGFLKLGSLAGTAAFMPGVHAAEASGSDRLRVAVIGCGGQGNSHIRALQTLPEVELAYVCDVDAERLAKAEKEAGGARGVNDLRRVLEDASVTGVVVATPDHWHAPAALMAIEAGKHVYVEKPCAHNVRESQLLLAAARGRQRVVQHGTQSRSSAGLQAVMRLLHEGVIGDVLSAECWNWQRRRDIGHGQPGEAPQGVDYDMWVGPAEMMPYQSNRFHYDWHWWHNFGCGDIGNDGIHEVDLALWGLGDRGHPAKVAALGGKYFFDDDQQFPDTQQVIYELGVGERPGERRMLVYTQRLWSTNYPYHVDSGVEFHGTRVRAFLSKRGKFEVVNERNEPVETAAVPTIQTSVADHERNWLRAIRGGATSLRWSSSRAFAAKRSNRGRM